MNFILRIVFFIILISRFYVITTTEEYCFADHSCRKSPGISDKRRFIFYDVNYPEGFNLRRDVYMRLAIFMHSVKMDGLDWHLVLPPWHHLYHWKSKDIGSQSLLPWSMFFDIKSMQTFAPVIEFLDYLDEVKSNKIDKVVYLHHYKDAFSSPDWEWRNSWNFSECESNVVCHDINCAGSSYMYDGSSYRGWFWGYRNISSLSVQCISFQGPASLLREIMDNEPSLSSIMVDRAEVAIHDAFGDSLYWKCRRSMRFSKVLSQEAKQFRYKFLGSNDTKDGTLRPAKWENDKAHRKAIGGPYVCAHLRRGDFLFGRSNQVPSIEYAAEQLQKILEFNKLTTVFISTDADSHEVQLLEKCLRPAKLVQYKPNVETRKKIKDGGVAIVDQIICSYARYFIGTHESTFTFRIQEEREIIGFPKNTTFNLFCAEPKKCFQSSQWTIVF